MSITSSTFKIRFPEFSSIDDSTIELYIEDSELILNAAFWSDKYNLGQAYLVAHFLKVSQRELSVDEEATSVLASKSVDGTSLSFATPQSSGSNELYYNSTSYGQRYLALRKTLGPVGFIV